MPAKDDCNQLLNATMPFAEQMLRDHGEFLPFGAQMLPDGEIVSVAADDGEHHSRSQDLIDILQATFKEGAVEGDLVATALVYDVRVVPPGGSQKSDAIALNLDHRDNYSVSPFSSLTSWPMANLWLGTHSQVLATSLSFRRPAPCRPDR